MYYLCIMLTEEPKYEEWLTTIVNTRLLFDKIDKFEDMMGNHSIHSNGVIRSYSTPQKLRAAFRDLKVEVALMTDGVLALDKVMEQYKEAWKFYKENLSRRTNPNEMALELLRYCYYPYRKDGLGKKKLSIFEKIVENNICVTFLVLMMLKAIPGYDSREGDVDNMPRLHEQALQLLETFTQESTMFDMLPAITKVRNEGYKNRLMLLYNFSYILDTFDAYATSQNLYETSSNLKQKQIGLNLDGYWNECGGHLDNTDFWELESASNIGTFFATHWHKGADNTLTSIKYTMFTSEADDGNVIVYLVHPESIKHRMKGLEYTDSDHTWYKTPRPDSDSPDDLPLQRLIASSKWQPCLHLTRVTDSSVIEQYNKWKEKCEIVKRFADCDYEFSTNLYAITRNALYIPSDNPNEYYKVPKDAYNGFEQIQLTDNVGTLKMNGKTYLAFDEFLLYIGTSKSELKKYGITKVDYID